MTKSKKEKTLQIAYFCVLLVDVQFVELKVKITTDADVAGMP